ncbi:MAG: hypothetical protein JWO44_1645 [Bacteroidetes bacterium]|nr:hypothetical protein [Bacteroidota bacterium]
MAKIKTKLKATTILESMVAMVIAVVCLSIGTMVIVNVLNSDKGYPSLKADLLLNSISNKLKNEKTFIDGEERIENLLIKKTFEKYADTENLLQMTLQVIDENNKPIFERKELILQE